MQVTNLDKACCFPIVQQVVGVVTFLSNVVMTIRDLAVIIFHKIALDCQERYGRRLEKEVQQLSAKSQETSIEVHDKITTEVIKNEEQGQTVIEEKDKKEIVINNPSDHLAALETKLENVKTKINDRKRKINETYNTLDYHVHGIGCGIIRAFPIVGTIYSALIWDRASHPLRIQP